MWWRTKMVWTELSPAGKRNKIKRWVPELSLWFWWLILGKFLEVLTLTICKIWKQFPSVLRKDINTGPTRLIFLNALLGGVWRYWIRFKYFLELSWWKGIEEFPLSINMSKKSWKHHRADLRPYLCLYLLLLFSSQKGTPKNVREGAFGMFHVTLILFQKKINDLIFPCPNLTLNRCSQETDDRPWFKRRKNTTLKHPCGYNRQLISG